MFNWPAFLIYAVLSTCTPGPNNIMSMANGTRKGFWRAIPFNFGIGAGFSIVMLLCTLFCKTLSDWIPSIKVPMLTAGTVYLFYLAWKTLRSTGPKDVSKTADGFLMGLILQFINPKIYVYGMMSMEAYILPHYSESPFILVFFALLMAAIGTFFTFCWAGFGAVLRRFFAEKAHWLNPVMAALLVYCAWSMWQA